MSIISVSQLNKSYGVMSILEDVSFHINKGDKIGIVGANGAGKSTLIKILAGEIEQDGGEIFRDKSISTGYLKQLDKFPDGGTVEEEIMKASDRFRLPDGADPKKWAMGMLKKVAFTEDYLTKPVNLLSGGERTRLALAALLLESPDLLLLDEPTNHLDIGTLKWLESFLKNYKGTLVIISHDRYFLDKTIGRIFEVEGHKLSVYEGNYTEYLEKKRLIFEDRMRHYQHVMEEKARQEEIIRRFKQHNTEHLVKRAQSREKMLEHMEIPDKPVEYNQRIKIRFDEKLQSGNDVVFVEGLKMSFGRGEDKRSLFENVNMDIKKGDRICIVGPNGIGKTTLLKLLLGELTADEGYIRFGTNVMPGYYDQEQKLLDPGKTVLDEVHSQYIKYDQTELRGLLGRFLFHGEDVFKQVSELSGGEKARLSLLKLMMSGSNLLIMDEPTNHLDIKAMEVFEDAILDFPGTVIIVSHDRYLLKKLPTAIYELGSDGIRIFLGNYDYYEEKSQSIASGRAYLNEMGRLSAADQTAADNFDKQLSKEERIAARQREKEEALAKRKNEKKLLQAEEAVAEAEKKIAELENQLCQPAVFANPARAAELSKQLDEAKTALDEKYEEWMSLQ